MVQQIAWLTIDCELRFSAFHMIHTDCLIIPHLCHQERALVANFIECNADSNEMPQQEQNLLSPMAMDQSSHCMSYDNTPHRIAIVYCNFPCTQYAPLLCPPRLG